jgi:hypothetical protein
MANQFPIQYAQRTTSGRSGSVRADLDVRTGEVEIAKQMQNLGRAGFEFFGEIATQQNAAELSDMKRQANEAWNVAWNTAQKQSDPVERASILQKAKDDAAAIKSKRMAVNQQYDQFLDDRIPNWDRWFTAMDLEMRKTKATSDLKYNLNKFLEDGNSEDALVTLQQGYDAGIMGEAEFKYKVENLHINMAFAQARIGMDTDPETTVKMLQSLEGLNGPQMDERDRLISYATGKRNQSNFASEQARFGLEAKLNGEIVNGSTNIQGMSASILETPGMNDEDKLKALNNVTAFFSKYTNITGGKGDANLNAMQNMERAVDDLVEGRIQLYGTEEKPGYYDILAENKGGLGTQLNHYIQQAEPSWNKFQQNEGRIADNDAKRQILTMTDAEWEIMQANKPNMNIDIFNAKAAQRKIQSQIYADYQNAVLELKQEKGLSPQEYRSRLKQIGAIYKNKNWIEEASNSRGTERVVIQQEKRIGAAYDSLTRDIGGSWSQLPAGDKRIIIERVMEGEELQAILDSVKAGDNF